MKAGFYFLVIFSLSAFYSCKQAADDLIIVDVTKSYPKKELILQDIMDVEYIVLDNSDEFITQGVVQSIGKDIILVKNNSDDGDIFVFDRTGKGLRKINRRGQGPEEYSFILGVTLDEENNEIFVRDISKGIIVYDLYGNYSRSFPRFRGAISMSMQDFDKEHFICHNGVWAGVGVDSKQGSPFTTISKADGHIVKDIQIHFKQAVGTMLDLQTNRTSFSVSATYTSIIPFQESWILTESSSDTIFRLLSDYSMIPFIVRTPSIHTMNPALFLFPEVLTDHYYFMETQKKEYNFETYTGFPKTKLMYDRQEQKIYEYVITNDDYAIKKTVDFLTSIKKNEEIAFLQKIEAYELVESYGKGQLKGRLKEIAAELDDESNPVIMLVKYKK